MNDAQRRTLDKIILEVSGHVVTGTLAVRLRQALAQVIDKSYGQGFTDGAMCCMTPAQADAFINAVRGAR
jgi:ribosomal protein RSM22 (predicted rRNA methylase)